MKIFSFFIFVFVLLNVLEQHSTKYLLVELEGHASEEPPIDDGTPSTCSSWPDSTGHECVGGLDYKTLDEAMDFSMKDRCKVLCQYEGVDGCCWLADQFGCYWMPGGHVGTEGGFGEIATYCSHDISPNPVPLGKIQLAGFRTGNVLGKFKKTQQETRKQEKSSRKKTCFRKKRCFGRRC